MPTAWYSSMVPRIASCEPTNETVAPCSSMTGSQLPTSPSACVEMSADSAGAVNEMMYPASSVDGETRSHQST